MTDMLVKLYDLEDDWQVLEKPKALGITLRKPIGPEKHAIITWVADQFGNGWASEADAALCNKPATCFVAVKDANMVGFACYDATALGFFGPIGVAKSYRNKGTGRALMAACLQDMKLKGYGYAIIGSVQDTAYYKKAVGAIEIPDSTTGIYHTRIRDSHVASKKRRNELR